MIEAKLKKLIDQAREDEEVLAVILSGSHARGEATPASESMSAWCSPGGPRSALSVTKETRLSGGWGVDFISISSFQFTSADGFSKEGRVLFARNEDALYEIAFRNARAFEDFRHHYEENLNKAAHAGS